MAIKHRTKICYYRFLEREAFSGFSSQDLFIMQSSRLGSGLAISNMAEGLRTSSNWSHLDRPLSHY